MGKDKKDKKEKKDKGQEVEETKKDKKGKKDKGEKKDKKDKGEKPLDGSAILQELVDGCTPAKKVKMIEDFLKKEDTPAGDYFVNTPSGKIRARKSAEAGKVTFQLNDKQITRSNLYNCVKVSLSWEQYCAKTDGAEGDGEGQEETKKDKKGKKDKKAPSEGDSIHDDGEGPGDAVLSASYKKKQLLNILEEGQIFKKKIIKALKGEITEKKLTGSEFIAAIDKITGEETPLEKVTAIFSAV